MTVVEILELLSNAEHVMTLQELITVLSDAEHVSWSSWMEWLFSRCTRLEDGSMVIPPASVERWMRQMKTNYDALSESEQKSDQGEVERIIPFILRYVAGQMASQKALDIATEM